MGKAPGNPRRSAPVPAGAGPAKDAAPGVEIRLRFNAEQWRDITRCAAHDQATPEKWLRNGALEWVPVTLDEIQRQAIPEKQQKAEDDELMFKIRYVMGWPATAIFSPDEKQAVFLCAEWEGMDFQAVVRSASLAVVISSFEDMEANLKDPEADPKHRALALRLHRKLAPIVAARGWDCAEFADRRAKA